MAENIKVYDCDGHIIESIAEMVPFLDPVDREIALNPSRNRQGVFAGLDAIHYPRNVHKSGEVEAPRRRASRMDRDDNVYTTNTGHSRSLNDYLASGQVLVGCEGNEWILPYVIKQCGAEAFSYARIIPMRSTWSPPSR